MLACSPVEAFHRNRIRGPSQLLLPPRPCNALYSLSFPPSSSVVIPLLSHQASAIIPYHLVMGGYILVLALSAPRLCLWHGTWRGTAAGCVGEIAATDAREAVSPVGEVSVEPAFPGESIAVHYTRRFMRKNHYNVRTSENND